MAQVGAPVSDPGCPVRDVVEFPHETLVSHLCRHWTADKSRWYLPTLGGARALCLVQDSVLRRKRVFCGYGHRCVSWLPCLESHVNTSLQMEPGLWLISHLDDAASSSWQGGTAAHGSQGTRTFLHTFTSKHASAACTARQRRSLTLRLCNEGCS